MSTPVTLAAIWSSTAEQLRPILQAGKRDVTGNLGLGRVTVAILYYNAGMLSPAEAEWVAHPRFVEVMSHATSLSKGLVALKTPFIHKLLLLGATFGGMADYIVNVVEGGPDVALTQQWANTRETDAQAAAGSAHDAELKRIVLLATTDDVLRSVHRAPGFGDVAGNVHLMSFADIIQAPGATSVSYGQAVATACWQEELEINAQSEAAMAEVKLTTIKDFQPSVIMAALLAIDPHLMVRKARCFYLYTLWELLDMVLPLNLTHGENKQWTQLVALIDQYGCSDVFAANILGTTMSEHLIEALGPLLVSYNGPPSHTEVIQSLLDLAS